MINLQRYSARFSWSIRASTILLFMMFALLLAFTVVFVSITATQINLNAGIHRSSPFNYITDNTFRLLSIDPNSLTSAQYGFAVNTAQNVNIVLITVWFAVLPVAAFIRHSRIERKIRSLQSVPVFIEGKDDYEFLMKFLSNAEQVVFYSASFHWLFVHDDFRDRVFRLAEQGKVRLVSYKTKDQVVATIGKETYDKLRNVFIVNSGKRIKCTYIRYPGASIFLYKYYIVGGSGQEVRIGFVQDTNESKYLLKTIDELIDAT